MADNNTRKHKLIINEDIKTWTAYWRSIVDERASSEIRPKCLLPGRPTYLTGQQVDKSKTRRTQIQLNNR